MYQILHKSKIWVTQVILTRTIFQSKEHSKLTTKTSTFPRCSVTARSEAKFQGQFQHPPPSNLIPKVQKSILFLLLKRLSQVIRSELLQRSSKEIQRRPNVNYFKHRKTSKFHRGILAKNLSIFGLFDGHSGNKCCDFLRDNFHLYLGL